MFAPDQSDQGPLDVDGVHLVFDERTELPDKNREPVRRMVNTPEQAAHQTGTRLNAIVVTGIAAPEQRPFGLNRDLHSIPMEITFRSSRS